MALLQTQHSSSLQAFKYSSELVLDDEERRFNPYHTIIKLNRFQPVPTRNRCIYECPYFPEDPSDQRINPNTYRFDVDWKDEQFKKIARNMIAPKRSLLLNIPSRHTVNIGIHIREGGGYDTDHTRLWDPLKLPPLSFYIQGLLDVLEHFKDRPIYCYLFTDALEPALLAAEFEKAIPKDVSIQIDYRQENNHHLANVLEDFFSFFNFDVLIHPQSNYTALSPLTSASLRSPTPPTNFIREAPIITITECSKAWDEILYKAVLKRTEMQ